MAFFVDNFTDTDGVVLQSHTPNTGTSWTMLWQTSAGVDAEINTNRCRSDGTLNAGVIYTADATYPSADYDVTCTLVTVVALNDRPIYLLVRIQDQENMYGVRIEETATESSLVKKVSGTWTAIGSLFSRPANGSVIKLEIIGTALKFYDDGVEIASATVSDHSAAGKAGIAFGGGAELLNGSATDDGSTTNVIDTLTVNDLAAGGTTYNQSASGGIAPSGAPSKQTATAKAGVIAPASALNKLTAKLFAGSLTPSSALETIKTFLKSFEGSITPAGTITRSTAKSIAGTLTPSVALNRLVATFYTGALTPSGAASKSTAKTQDGTVAPTGTITRPIGKVLAGTLALAGTISKAISKLFAGALSLAGTVTSTGGQAAASPTVGKLNTINAGTRATTSAGYLGTIDAGTRDDIEV